ncbi:MAG: hypothetical protein Q8O14_15290 [bacterium]|nr:hypothetical protein [bacterium]
MNVKMLTLATLLAGSGLVWAQDIVLKASFISFGTPGGLSCSAKVMEPIDVNNDGCKELPTGNGYYDAVSLHRYTIPYEIRYVYPQGSGSSYHIVYGLQMRNPGSGEYFYRIPNTQTCQIIDIESGALLASLLVHGGPIVLDYDSDGFDDVIVQVDASNQNFAVYGIATGNPPISPPQELDIQQVGQDYVISWTPVPTATAYRIEWSSALDGGVRFTRIGYTPSTTFTHRNQVDQERGFYRVLSEDNGTGVVMMVGQGR